MNLQDILKWMKEQHIKSIELQGDYASEWKSAKITEQFGATTIVEMEHES